jgi:hypothetical protein
MLTPFTLVEFEKVSEVKELARSGSSHFEIDEVSNGPL